MTNGRKKKQRLVETLPILRSFTVREWNKIRGSAMASDKLKEAIMKELCL